MKYPGIQLIVWFTLIVLSITEAEAQKLYLEEDGTNTLPGSENDYLQAIEKSDARNLSTNVTDWFISAGKYPEQAVTIEPALSLSGYPTSTGNALRVQTKDPDGFNFDDNVVMHRRLGNPSGAQTLYLSFVASVFRVNKIDAVSFPVGFGEVINDDDHPANVTGGLNYRLLIKHIGTVADDKAGDFQFGLGKLGGTNAIATSKTYKANGEGTGDAAIFVVMRVTMDGDATDGDDRLELYTSTSLPSAEPASWDLSVSDGSDALINALFLREKMDDTDDHFVDLYGIRVADSWAGLLNQDPVPVTSITVTPEEGYSNMVIDEDPVQFQAEIAPANASFKTVTWSIENDVNGSGGQAEITETGWVTATKKGTVRVIATANDGSGGIGDYELDIVTFVDPETPFNVSPTGVTLLPDDYKLMFSDEFNDTSVDLNKWSIRQSTKTRNPRPEIGIDQWFWKSDNVSESGGHLVLDVDKADANTMHTGSIWSNDKFEMAYGYYEVSFKIPETSKGSHAAFWFQGDNMGNVNDSGQDGAEIDVFESAWVDDLTKSVVHIDGYGNDHQANTKQFDTPGLHDGNFHTWGLLWEPEKLTIYYDGTKKVTYSDTKWVPQVEQFIYLSCGATFGYNAPGQASDFTFTSEPIGYLTTGYVDYIRVWKNLDDTPSTVYEAEFESYTTEADLDGYDPIREVCDNASGSKVVFLHGNDESHNHRSIGFDDIHVETAGTYELKIQYYTGENGSNPFEMRVNGVMQSLDFSNTGDDFCGSGLGTFVTTVTLVAGTNTISFSPKDCTNANNDCLSSPYLDFIKINSAGPVDVSSIAIASEGDVREITNEEPLQFTATVTPTYATNSSVTWSVTSSDGGGGTISEEGLFEATSPGTVTVTAMAKDGSGVSDDFGLVIHPILVTSIEVTSASGTTVFRDATSQMSATVLPTNATDAGVTWSVTNNTGEGSIDNAGLFTAESAGVVTVAATANDGSGVQGSLLITIESVPVSSITISSAKGEVLSEGVTSQMTADVHPENASNTSLTWGITNGTGQGTIDSDGLFTAVSEGTVTITATAEDGSGIVGSLDVLIEAVDVAVAEISVNSEAGTIVLDGETSQMTAEVLPSNASNQTVSWSVTNGTGAGAIDGAGLFTAASPGTVTIVATANDGSGTTGNLEITVQEVPVTSIAVSSSSGTTLDDGTTSQMTTVILPSNASNQAISWSVTNGTGAGTINYAGLFTAASPGTVTVVATANDGSGITGSLEITVQEVPVASIVVTSSSGTALDDGTTSQMTAAILPSNASNQAVSWSVTNGTGAGAIDGAGLFTAASPGTVTIVATANDGSGITGSLEITVEEVLVTSIVVNSASGTTLDDGATAQLTAEILPSNASNQAVSWSMTNDTGAGTIDDTGLFTASSPGTVTVVATATDGSGIQGSLEMVIEEVIILVTAINLTSELGGLLTEGDVSQIVEEVFPSEATNTSVTWSVTNGTGAATIDENGLLTAVTEGIVTVVATADDGSGVTGNMEIQIHPQPLGIAGHDHVTLYPNPVTHSFKIQLKNAQLETVELLGMDGRRVLKTNEIDDPITISILAKGTYLVKVRTKAGDVFINKIFKH